MMDDQKKRRTPDWEAADPKIPVIRCGHMENRVEHLENIPDPVDKTGESGI